MKFKKVRLYYYSLVLLAILILISHYPHIYGTDGFQLMWMTNALRDGALFSKNTWLIHPTSYFGYYPFSHRAIGVPLILAFLWSLVEFISLGIFGLIETIFVFDFILILIIYKSSLNLGNVLFKEEWSRFMFVATIIFSQNMLDSVIMVVSTRVFITIIMIVFLNLNLKILTKSINVLKTIIIMCFLLLGGALVHKLWIGTIVTIIITFLIILVRKYQSLLKLTVFLILPLSFLAFFLGLGIIILVGYDIFLETLDPNLTFSPLFNVETLLGLGILLSWFYAWNLGLIIFFFPIGVIKTTYDLVRFLNTHKTKNTKSYDIKQFYKKFYLILFILPFSFLLSFTFYSMTLFFPILIIFSLYGIIYIKDFFSTHSEKLSWIMVGTLFIISIIYSLLKVELTTRIDLWYIYVFSFGFIILLLILFLLKKNKYHYFSIFSYKSLKIENGIWVVLLTFSILVFSVTSIQTNRVGSTSSPYPWENRYLTDEEFLVIDFFRDEEFDGLIFTFDVFINLKLTGFGFLPSFHGYTDIGIGLWYGLISSDEVLENTQFFFTLPSFLKQIYFKFSPEYATWYFETFPLELIKRKIIELNIIIEDDRNLLKSEYNVQYVITTNENTLHESNEWLLIQSLFQSELEPVFTTQNLVVWKIN